MNQKANTARKLKTLLVKLLTKQKHTDILDNYLETSSSQGLLALVYTQLLDKVHFYETHYWKAQQNCEHSLSNRRQLMLQLGCKYAKGGQKVTY